MSGQNNGYEQRLTFKTIILIGLVALVVLNFSNVVYIIEYLYGIIFPLLLGFAMAYVMNILVVGYERIFFIRSSNRFIISLRRMACVLMSLVTVVFVIWFFLHIIIPQFSRSIGLLAAGFPIIYTDALLWADQYADQVPVLEEKLHEYDMDGNTALKKALTFLGNWAWGTVSLMGSVFGWVVNFILASIFAIYLLLGKNELELKFDNMTKAYLQADHRERLYEYLQAADESFSNFIAGQFKEAVILGLLCTIGMLLFGFPYATIIGPVMGLTALIPLLGAYIGALVGFLLIVIVDPLQALFFIVFIVVLQQIEGNLIFPKVVGDSIGLPGIWVFVAVVVGAGLFGIAGILLGVPLAATFYKLIEKDVNKRLG